MASPFQCFWFFIISLAVANYGEGRRIIAVGDLHGDLNQTLSVLRLAGLIDDRMHWIGNDTFFVQVGDILDVGPDDLMIVRLFMKLEKEAQAVGGDLIQLLGNHEIRNLIGDYSAVDPQSLAHSRGKKGRDILLSNQTDLGMYLRTRKAIFHHKEYLFMHGGFSTATSSMITGINKVEEFNIALRNMLVNSTMSSMGKTATDLTEQNIKKVSNPILVRSILHVRCEDLKRVMNKKFPGIASVVVGHVPHNPKDFADWRVCDGRLIAIDFGLSRWKKGDPGHVAALDIDDVSGHVQLIESTVEFIDFKSDVHKENFVKWIWSSPRGKQVVFLILLFFFSVLLGVWITSKFRERSLSGTCEQWYGGVDVREQI